MPPPATSLRRSRSWWRGREVQERFFARLLHNTDAATREAFFRTMEVIGKNLDEILKENG